MEDSVISWRSPVRLECRSHLVEYTAKPPLLGLGEAEFVGEVGVRCVNWGDVKKFVVFYLVFWYNLFWHP